MREGCSAIVCEHPSELLAEPFFELYCPDCPQLHMGPGEISRPTIFLRDIVALPLPQPPSGLSKFGGEMKAFADLPAGRDRIETVILQLTLHECDLQAVLHLFVGGVAASLRAGSGEDDRNGDQNIIAEHFCSPTRYPRAWVYLRNWLTGRNSMSIYITYYSIFRYFVNVL